MAPCGAGPQITEDGRMARIGVLGAGVVGSVYAALLTRAGHDVTAVVRGHRADDLRRGKLRVVLDGEDLDADVRVVESLADLDCDVLAVCVRGDQMESVLDEVAAHPARAVLVFANPLGLRPRAEERIGRERLVWCFSGVGGSLEGAVVSAHRVRQQATVVETGRPASPIAEDLLAAVDPRLRREPDMAAWFDTHSVFVAGMGAVLLLHRYDTAATRWTSADQLVRAMSEAFRALEARGTRVVPGNLRAIFGRVPRPVATAYWAAQFGRPVVQVSMVPHARATRDTEQRQVARYALALVGDAAPRFADLVEPLSRG